MSFDYGGRSPCFAMCGDDICRDHGCRHVYKSPPPGEGPSDRIREYVRVYAIEAQARAALQAALSEAADALEDIADGDWQRYPNRERHGHIEVEDFAAAEAANARAALKAVVG